MGAVVGALIGHYTARARGREEHERTLELLLVQDERRAAQAALGAARRIRNAVNSQTDPGYGGLHNDWQDSVLAAARLIRSDELLGRAQAGLYAIFLAISLPQEHTSFVVAQGARDVEAWIEAWLRGEEPSPAMLPRMQEMSELVYTAGEVPSMDRLNDLLARRG